MPAYRLTGGPCHWDLHVCYYLFLSPRYVRRFVGNPNTDQGRRQIRARSNRLKARHEGYFDEFFNPDKADGEWQLYEFGACCSFHIDVEIHLPPAAWAGMNEQQIRQQLPQGCAMMVVDSLNMAEHPHASRGGERLLIDAQGGKYTFVHEVGHNLGLPDQYRTPDVPELGVQGNGMTAEEEAAHVGHLMGKKDKRGRRAIQPHEMEEIAAATGMTCEEDECCPDRKQGERGKLQEVEKTAQRQAEPGEGPEGARLHRAAEHLDVLGAHQGVALDFDIALEMLGPSLLETYLREEGEGGRD